MKACVFGRLDERVFGRLDEDDAEGACAHDEALSY